MNVVWSLRHRAVPCLTFSTGPWTAWTSGVPACLCDCLPALGLKVRFRKSTEILKSSSSCLSDWKFPSFVLKHSVGSDTIHRRCVSVCVCMRVHALAGVAEQISSGPISDAAYKPVSGRDENEIMSQQPCGERSCCSGTSSNQIPEEKWLEICLTGNDQCFFSFQPKKKKKKIPCPKRPCDPPQACECYFVNALMWFLPPSN